MKRFLTILFILLVCLAQPVYSQVKFGLKAGMNVSQLRLNEGLFEGSNRTGFFAGPTVEFTMPLSLFSIDCSVLYDRYDVCMRRNETKLSETLQYIDVPVNVSLNFGVKNVFMFYLSTGPQLAFNCSGTHILDGNYSLDNTMLSWNAGAGFRLFKSFHVSYTYNIGIGYTAELTNHTTATADMGKRLYNPTHKVGFTYFF